MVERRKGVRPEVKSDKAMTRSSVGVQIDALDLAANRISELLLKQPVDFGLVDSSFLQAQAALTRTQAYTREGARVLLRFIAGQIAQVAKSNDQSEISQRYLDLQSLYPLTETLKPRIAQSSGLQNLPPQNLPKGR